MKNCKIYRQWFADAFYNELSEDQRMQFEEHLDECPDCRAEYSQICSVLSRANDYQRPEPDAGFWDSYWENLEHRIEVDQQINTITVRDKKRPGWIPWNLSHIYRPVAAAAVFLIIGIVIGKSYFGPAHLPSEQTMTVAVPPDSTAAAQENATEYIEQAKLVLLGIVNYDTVEDGMFRPSFSRNAEISRELVSESAALKESLNMPAQRRMRELITDLEEILIQIADLEDEYDMEDVVLIQNDAEQRSILFKIYMNENLSPDGGKTKSQDSPQKTTL